MRLHLTWTALFLFSYLFSDVFSDTRPIFSAAPVTSYRMPSLFALNDGKPFYLDKNPVTGAFDFTSGGKEMVVAATTLDTKTAESSSVASEATAEDDEEGEETAADGEKERPKPPLRPAPVVEETEEDDDEPPPRSRPTTLPKEQIERKDTAASTKSKGGRPNDIQEEDGDANPYFHQFLNLNVHEYGDRIPGASSIREDPYSFGSLNLGSSPLERGYKFPLISSSYANTKVQGVGGNYYYGDKGKQDEKDKEKYKPGYGGYYSQPTTRRPAPSYYHETDEDEHYGSPSKPAASTDEDEDHKYSAEESSHHGGHDDHDGAEEEEEEEGDESIDDLVEEVSDYEREPVHPKKPQSPGRQPPKKHQQQHHHHSVDEEEEEGEEDHRHDRPYYFGGPTGDKPHPTQQHSTYYYSNPAEEEDEEQQDRPHAKPTTPHRGEEDRPRPSHVEEEEVDEDDEESEEGGETNIEERPPPPSKPSTSSVGFGAEYDKEGPSFFGEKVQGSQKIEKPGNKPGHGTPTHGFPVGGYFASSDREEPHKRPSVDEDSETNDSKRPTLSNQESKKETTTIHPSTNPQILKFTPAQITQIPTERPFSSPTPYPTREAYRPTYPSPYGIEEPFRPIYGPEEGGESGSFVRPVQTYVQQPNKNQQYYPSSVRPSTTERPQFLSTPNTDTRPSSFQHYDNYFPVRPLNTNELPQKKKDSIEESQKEPVASTYKPLYETKIKKPTDLGISPWKVEVNEAPRPTQEIPKDTSEESSKPGQNKEEDNSSKRPPTLPPPPFREVVGIGSVGEPEYIRPTQKPSYGPFRFPDQEYAPQRPSGQQTFFVPRPNSGQPVNPNLSNPPPFGLGQQNPQRPVLPPSASPILRPQGIDGPPHYHPHRPQGASGAPPPPASPPRRWEERPILPSTRPQSFLHRPRPQEQPQQTFVSPPPTSSHPYKFVSRKPGQEPVLMGTTSNAVFNNDKKAITTPPNGPKAQVPDPNLPNILPQFRPNAKISYSTIQREKGPFGPPPPPQFGPNQRVSNLPERPPIRQVASYYENLKPPPPPNNLRLHRIQGEIPYGPPQVYAFGPGGSPPVGRRSGQQHQARVGDEKDDNTAENSRKRPHVTTLQMMRNGLMDHQAARHPIISKEDVGPKTTAETIAEIHANPTVYVSANEGSTSASLSVDSSASEEHPVFVVYPVSDSSHQEDGVVVGTRGSQKPLPPSSIAAEEVSSVFPSPPNAANSDFPYPLVRPISEGSVETKPTVLGPVYTLIDDEGPKERVKDNSESNIIPYIQDYSPYATKKPLIVRDGDLTSMTTEIGSSTAPVTSVTKGNVVTPKAPVSIVNAWQPDSEVEVSATMHADSPGVPMNHRPLIEEKSGVSSPPPLNFQAPFLASENIEPSPDSGWSAVGGSTSTATAPQENTSSISKSDTNIFGSTSDTKDSEGETENNSKFDFDNFKPQLFGGFKPIYSALGDESEDFKYATVTTERQER